jgi:hypothetical protein
LTYLVNVNAVAFKQISDTTQSQFLVHWLCVSRYLVTQPHKHSPHVGGDTQTNRLRRSHEGSTPS